MYDDGPRIVIWETTRACALACAHCRAEAMPHRDRRELTTDEARRLIDEVADWGKAIFILTGGDPLMRADIYEIAAYAAGRGLRVAISPSVTGRLTAKSIAGLAEAGCKRISLSLDGPDAKSHDAFRGVRGVFERTLKSALGAVQAGMELQINTTIARHNHEHIRDMADLVESLGATMWSLFFLVPTGRARRDQALDALETEAAFATLYDVWTRSAFDIKTTEAPHYRRFVAQQLAASAVGARPRKSESQGLRFPAIADGKGFVFVSHIGDIQPSGFLPLTCGNVRTDSFLFVYRNHHLMRRLRNPDTFVGKCGSCDFRLLCGGSRARAYTVDGNPFASDPSCSYVASLPTPVAV
jgi:radical SAM protein